MAILGTLVKQPTDELDYDISYSRFLTETDELTSLNQPEITITPEEPNGLRKGAVNVMEDRLKIWLMDGVAGTEYKVEINVTTNEGRVRQDEFFIVVEDY